MDILSFTSLIAYILVSSLRFSIAANSIAVSRSITDGMTLVSQYGTYELGFFTPGNSKKRYLGIWYKNIPMKTVVWVANRLKPTNDSSGILTLNSTGNLVLSQNGTVVWYTTLQKQAQKPVAELLDSGNLVIRDEEGTNPEDYLWQSFDYPSDTWLPQMKFGWDLRKGLKWELTAWKSPDDPAPGDFAFVSSQSNYPDSYWMKAGKKYMRYGPWNGLRPSGLPELMDNSIYNYSFVYNKDEMYYYSYYLKNNSVYSKVVINQTDYTCSRHVWVEAEQNWAVYKSKPVDYCDHYGLCGLNGNCIISESPVCQCLNGFSPKSPQNWDIMDWSQGCVRNKPLNCSNENGDGFVQLAGLKLPDTTNTWLDEKMGLEECRIKCLNNCSCMAYTNSDIRGQGSGCAMWFGDLIDIRQSADVGQDLYIRIAASELDAENSHRKRLKTILVATIIAAVSGILLVGCCIIYRVCGNMTDKSKTKAQNNEGSVSTEDDLNHLLFDHSTIANATNNFSLQNKIGQGGFGSVYKGRLVNGKEIAVKRLSSNSTQGMIEFRNEVNLIAKLQHRNLVKLLGCCIQGQEKVLVYEYMPNGSLDSFIFDQTKGKLLDWPKRFQIICGIARGLTYLHQDSRLRIIHRDLKASNVLLNDKLEPKISDFGMAKIFGGEQSEGKTKRVVGTYGYMAPEYAADGMFSVKSDVFSFGILMMEIIYGQKNKGFYHADQTHNLIGYAWILWKEGRALELIDRNIEDSCILSEVTRCIHVSLLCVQQRPKDRPTMSSIVLMLESEMELVEPKQPGFFPGKISFEAKSSSSTNQSSSTNEITMSLIEAR